MYAYPPPPPPSGWVSLRGFFLYQHMGGGGGRGGRKCKHRSETRYKTNIIYCTVLGPVTITHIADAVTETLLLKNLSFPLYCITPRKPLCQQGLRWPYFSYLTFLPLNYDLVSCDIIFHFHQGQMWPEGGGGEPGWHITMMKVISVVTGSYLTCI